MKKRFTEEQISFDLRHAEGVTPVTEVCRKMGISEQSFYRWKRKYEGIGVAELRRLLSAYRRPAGVSQAVCAIRVLSWPR